MRTSASILTDQFSEVLGRLPKELDLDGLAHQTGALRRGREIKNGVDLFRLCLARGPGGLSLRETAAWVSWVGIADISNPAVKYRLDHAIAFQEAVAGHILQSRTGGAAPLWPGRTIRISDGSSISEPGSAGIDWRVHGVFDLGRGGFSHLELTDVKGAESVGRGAPVTGEIRIADRNFAKARALQTYLRAGNGSTDVIVRMGWNAFKLNTPDGEPFDLIAHLGDLPAGEGPHEVMVEAQLGRCEPALKLRLILLRKSPEAAEATRAALRRQASRKQKQVDPRSLFAAEFLMLATTLAAAAYPAAQVLVAYRLRWQIELAFKRLKSLLNMDKLPTWTERGSRSWLLAHIILALLCDDLSQEVLESSP